MKTDCEGNPIPEGMHEYAFDVKLFAVVRVVAPSQGLARKAMQQVLDAADIDDNFRAGFNSESKVKITEASVEVDDEAGGELFEIDGECV